ncbi:hypothetical protein GC194_00475 [bacterium]|nr:hypothetical protein [bacterium]
MEKKNKKEFLLTRKHVQIVSWVGLLLLIFSLFLPALLSQNTGWWDFSTTGEIGDTIGGILTPAIAVIAAGLTFLAFYVQFEANQQQKNDIARERLERKFYQLLELHKKNVDELQLNEKIKGRHYFPHLFNEFKASYYLCEKLMKETNQVDSLDDEMLIDVAYRFMFLGTNSLTPENIPVLFSRSSFPFILKAHNLATDVLHRSFDGHMKQNPHFPLQGYIFQDNNPKRGEPYLIYHKPFSGHSHQLGHYFRNLFHMVKLIDQNTWLSDEEKKDFTRIIRAQLSNEEQLMLYYNAQSNYGKAWFENGYFKKYKLVHNMPVQMAEIGLNPKSKFISKYGALPNGEEYFEWDER